MDTKMFNFIIRLRVFTDADRSPHPVFIEIFFSFNYDSSILSLYHKDETSLSAEL